jgi:hypothetical protein
MPNIPTIKSHRVVAGEDPAAIVPLAQLKFAPPSIRSANNTFVWPLGAEGFRRSGSATLGIHKYLGAANVSVQVIHLDEAHIEMNGTFPGLTSPQFMEQLLAVITADGSKDLFLPGIFSRIQRVFTESYDFTHPQDDRTHSIDYTISFVRTTIGATVPATTSKTGQTVSAQRAIPGSPRATVSGGLADNPNTYVVAQNAQSLREIAGAVYGDADEWTKLVDMNKEVLDNYNPGIGLPAFKLPTTRLPIGTKLVY